MDELKRAAAQRAVEFVTSGMVVGLGSGSTARYATLRIAEHLRTGELANIIGIPTSDETAQLARDAGIPLATLDEHPHVDVTIDGADEVDPHLDLVKGKHGYLLREKIVAAASQRAIIIVDESKLVERLGTRSSLPVEVVHFGWRSTEGAVARTGACTARRMVGEQPFLTDEGHYIIDCVYRDGIPTPAALETALNNIPGVVSTGLFVAMAHLIVVARTSGVYIVTR